MGIEGLEDEFLSTRRWKSGVWVECRSARLGLIESGVEDRSDWRNVDEVSLRRG